MAVVMVIGSGTVAAEVADLIADTEYVVVDRLPDYQDAPDCRDVEIDDELKPSMNFYQTKMHRRKKGGKVSFR